MLSYAIKMLMGDRAKYIGIILGLTFGSFIITQQAAIFVGIMTRTFGFITDTSQPDIWVMNPDVRYIDDIQPLKDTQLFRVRGIEGVEWAVPLYKGLLKARLRDGKFQNCIVVGIDEATFIGGPSQMVQGRLEDLRKTDAIIVNKVGAETKLTTHPTENLPAIPLQIGDSFELNDHRAVVVGLCNVSRTFQSQPVVYTTYNRATTMAPQERKLLSFILVKASPSISPKEMCNRIRSITGLAAYTSHEFKKLTVLYYLINTGIPINFGMSVLLGFLIGTAIAGQTFYNFTLDNLRYFGTFKAMGAPFPLLRRMILLQALIVGAIGWGLGVGAAALFGLLSKNTELSFRLPWQLLLASGIAIFLISSLAAILSLQKVKKLDPAIVFMS